MDSNNSKATRKRVLVTGANRGIGLEIARGLTDLDYDVLLGSRDLQNGTVAAQEVGATPLQLDVASESSIAEAVKSACSIDVLINNAGVYGSGGILDDPNEFSSAMNVMVHGPFLLMHYLVPSMIERDFGRIVNVSLGYGAFSYGIAGPGAYGVAKAALNALTVATSRSFPDTVKVNAMCPGWVRTRMGGPGATLSPKEGADTAIWLATLGTEGPTGGFFRERKEISW